MGAQRLRRAYPPEVRGPTARVPVLRSRDAAAGRRRAVARPLALGFLRSRIPAAGAVTRGARRRLHRDHGGARDERSNAQPAEPGAAPGPGRVSAAFDVDVAVIGAGIHGAGLAQAAAAAGHSVLLLEQTAIAAGSSSRSSKLIHGGLRYLETGQLHLVRESLRERSTLLRLAPGLVRLQRFYFPIYRQTRRRAWQLRVGLSLYALLAGFTCDAPFGTVPP